MGKQRRERQKYHLSRMKSTNDAAATGTESCESNEKPLQESSILLPVPENLFAGINISIDNLKQSLKDSDSRSVISKKSLSAGNVISKKEKRKLRHEAFIKKLETAYHVRKDSKKQRRLKTSPLKTEAQPQSDKFPLLNLSDKLPPLNLNIELAQKSSSSKKKPVIKQRSIPKAKRRNNVIMNTFKCVGYVIVKMPSFIIPVMTAELNK
ncbi:uncharacterized protein LOC111867090 isoform X2 [Cryptotermes secundus]|uniref:uncharacterized protein LOC111867090 isoform X2 n=1 Tax=Cryptotermes secundus TaxID=105785 RepID=UPI000CD7BD10|nr:uncharacterized protein LOC111867090 isoform X2 [Cryptotermes secundus]